jgi:hypothetical protein
MGMAAIGEDEDTEAGGVTQVLARLERALARRRLSQRIGTPPPRP